MLSKIQGKKKKKKDVPENSPKGKQGLKKVEKVFCSREGRCNIETYELSNLRSRKWIRIVSSRRISSMQVEQIIFHLLQIIFRSLLDAFWSTPDDSFCVSPTHSAFSFSTGAVYSNSGHCPNIAKKNVIRVFSGHSMSPFLVCCPPTLSADSRTGKSLKAALGQII